jgi:hypothetical protein
MPKHGFEIGHPSNIPNSTDMSANTTSAADALGQKKGTNAIPQEVRRPFSSVPFPSPAVLVCTPLTSPQNPSIISSAGAIGKQFNPDGAIGQIGEKIGGPLGKEGMIGSQFDASKNGIAGHVERAVDGPRNPAGSGTQ